MHEPDRTPPRPGRLHRWVAAFDRLLGVREGGRAPWVRALPPAVLAGTVLAFLVIGAITSAPLDVSLPNGVIIAVVMAILTVACLSPGEDAGEEDPPGGDGRDPVLGSPGGPWLVVARLGPPAPPTGPQSRERELVGSRR